MKSLAAIALLVSLVISPIGAFGQSILTGLLQHERWPGSSEMMPMTAVYAFTSLPGYYSEAVGFRTWEMHPAGWYFMPGPAGRHTLVFSNPAGFMRPLVMTNLFTQPGDKVDRPLYPTFDHAVCFEGAWDEKPASDYYQTFVAAGTSVTQVGFKLATDGVDGQGPAGQNLLISIHRSGKDTPDTWEQIGPAMPVLNVDCGGVKGYSYSAGWNSGDVPVEAGETYAVRLRAEASDGTFQAFWRPDDDKTTDCYRIGTEGKTGWQSHDIWMTVTSDNDGLMIPYNKCVHLQFGQFAGGARTWAQTYVAQGRSLASTILYAAVSGAQPQLKRQRVAVRVRQGGPKGPIVGTEKIAIGNGNYTGDASWGTFGTTFAPGEIPLTPGQTYAIEFESVENYETLHGFVNIKGVVSDEIAAFNPYRKADRDTCDNGTAYRDGVEKQDFDLDMQVIEYQYNPPEWQNALTGENLIANGDMEAGKIDTDDPEKNRAEAWKRFVIDTGTEHHYLLDGKQKDNRIIRVIGGSASEKTVDGGFCQAVGGLDSLETYRITGHVRSSWPVDDKHQCFVGYDPTGQTDDPKYDTIIWSTLPNMHGHFLPFQSEPIRPVKDRISIWLRGKTTHIHDAPFKADFDNFALRRVNTGVPAGLELAVMTFNIRYGTANDGANAWDKRRDLVSGVITNHAPDVIGLQEALRFQMDQILEKCPQYSEIGVGRDDGKTSGEYSAILYLTEKLDLEEQDTFWLSDTPTVPGSKSWGNDIPRICTYARLRDKTSGTHFYVFNTHLDHVSQPSRERGAELIAKRIADRKHPDPVILTGDLNAEENNLAVRYLKGFASQIPGEQEKPAPSPKLVDTFRALAPQQVDAGTFGGYEGRRWGAKIDYVLAPPEAVVLEAEILYDNDNGRYPSDHYPVTARLLLPLRQ